MKKLILIPVLTLIVFTVYSQQYASNFKTATFNWVEGSSYDFGEIKQGSAVEHTFLFTNTGVSPLIISSAKGSCGCTVASFTNDPILPGMTGEIKATFDAKKVGLFTKTITVYSNAGDPEIIRISGQVVE